MNFLECADTAFVRRFCDPDQRQSLLDGLLFRKRLWFFGMWFAIGLGGLIAVFGLAPAMKDDESFPLIIPLGLATFVLFTTGVTLLLVHQIISERLLLLRVIDQMQRGTIASNQPPNADA